MTPAQSLLLGFTVLTLFGAYLLTLRIASAEGVRQPFVDAVFTATSAVTTTGLIVVDTGSYYSTFGQWVILALFQIGGLGYMAFVAGIAFVVGSRVSPGAGLTIEESLAGARYGELKGFLKTVFLFTLLFEGIGTIGLSLVYARDFPVTKALALGFFHAVSAFCTAGFSLFADSFVRYRDSLTANIVVAIVTVAGGIGFFVLRDLLQFSYQALAGVRHPRLSVHTRLTLLVSGVLLLGGTVLVLIAERHLPGVTWSQRILTASFQAFSASTTTGFNSVDIGAMTATSLFAIVVLMFVGTGPGGTGGGIKTTTLGVVLAAALALLKGGQDPIAFKRRLPQDTVYRALAIGMVATAWITVVTLIMTSTEHADFLKILFEVVSALGTVGLSMGITPELSTTGKILLSLTMLAGRLGLLAVGFALVGRPRPVYFRYLEERVYIG
ncbi:MAG TPA: potassium transporter TrkG [bacterium]|jgi:trk system potassium uptake protein TrkH|nr:potassium transporter TrkG [bacterium]